MRHVNGVNYKHHSTDKNIKGFYNYIYISNNDRENIGYSVRS